MRALPLALAACLALSACGEGGAKPAPKAPSLSIGETAVARVSVQDRIAGTGTVAAARTTDVGPRVDGIVDAIWVRVGDRVAADQPLFRTRQREFELQVKELEQRAAQARSDLEKAERDRARTADLHAKGVASVTALNDSTTKLDQARALAGVAQAQLDRARQALVDTVVRAPYAGVITRRNVDEGGFMNARSFGMPGGGGAVVQIMEIDLVAAIVQIPSIHVDRLTPGTPAKVRIDGLGGAWDSTIAIVNDRVDTATRSVEVRLPIANVDHRIKPGLFARAEIMPPPRPALTLARRAVLGSETDRFVFVAEQGKARRRPIVARDLDAQSVEVIEGLGEGDKVLDGASLAQVFDGADIDLAVKPGA